MGRVRGTIILPETLRQCGLTKFEEFNRFLQEKRMSRHPMEVKFKVSPASSTATNELSEMMQYLNTNKRVSVLESKCSKECSTDSKSCRACKALPCPKSYLVPPMFHQLNGNVFGVDDETSAYIVIFKR